jgi:hypothetical protein
MFIVEKDTFNLNMYDGISDFVYICIFVRDPIIEMEGHNPIKHPNPAASCACPSKDIVFNASCLQAEMMSN